MISGLDPSVLKEELKHIFGFYGEIKKVSYWLLVFNFHPFLVLVIKRWYQLLKCYVLLLQIYEYPEMNHIKYIEFYDVRGAEASLRSLNGICIAGKHIKLEPGHPKNATRWLLQFFIYFWITFSSFFINFWNSFLLFSLPILVIYLFRRSLHLESTYLFLSP
jgi:RNA recognition motif-containing protein